MIEAHENPERDAVRKATRRLVPFLLSLYVVAWLDRVNVGFAGLQMNRDLGFDAAVYGFGAGIFFIAYAACEVPSNLILHTVGARRWIARIMITWGLLSASMLLVHSRTSFYVLRCLLGAAEAGFFPGIIYYIGNWFPRVERARAMAGFTAAIPLSSVIGGPLSGALLGLNGVAHLAGWQWLFLVEGIPAVVLGLVVFRFLPDEPRDANWLSPAQRQALSDAIARERDTMPGARQPLTAVFKNPLVWVLGVAYFLGSICSYGLTLWMPEILKGLSGLSNALVGVISAVPYLIATIATLLVGRHSDRTGERVRHVAVTCFVGALGFGVSAVLHSPWFGFVALTVAAAGTFSRNGPFWALPSLFLAGQNAAAGIAFINTIGALGGFAGPYVIGVVKKATGSFTGGLLFLSGALLVAGMLALTMTSAFRGAAHGSPAGTARGMARA